jgi:hypothetical protein
MIKKLVFVGAGLALLLGLIFGRESFSYMSTAWSRMHNAVKDNVPVNFEIQRARKMIKQLRPEIEKNLHLIAKEEVEIDKLDRQISTLAQKMGRDERALKKLNNDLSNGTQLVYHGRRYTEEQVKTDLATRFAQFKTNKATETQLNKILKARKDGLQAARENLEAMLSSKRKLEVDIANLEARRKMVEVAKTSSEFNFDNSKLARVKDLLGEIDARIKVEEKLVNNHVKLYDRIPVDEDSEVVSGDITSEISNYFEKPSSKKVATDSPASEADATVAAQ